MNIALDLKRKDENYKLLYCKGYETTLWYSGTTRLDGGDVSPLPVSQVTKKI